MLTQSNANKWLPQLFRRLPSLVSLHATTFSDPDTDPSSTLFTDPEGYLLPSRPALLVSSTSWTADEDFSVLLRALSEYERAARSLEFKTRRLPKLVVLITGKGAGKKAFEEEVARREQLEGWESVRVRTEWLEREDYPRLLGVSQSSARPTVLVAGSIGATDSKA
jgi:beta-1,4-mannosyltransferase